MSVLIFRENQHQSTKIVKSRFIDRTTISPVRNVGSNGVRYSDVSLTLSHGYHYITMSCSTIARGYQASRSFLTFIVYGQDEEKVKRDRALLLTKFTEFLNGRRTVLNLSDIDFESDCTCFTPNADEDE